MAMPVVAAGFPTWDHTNMLSTSSQVSMIQRLSKSLPSPRVDLALTPLFMETEGLAKFAVSNITSAQRSRINYPLSIITKAPTMFALENRTWWWHALLWEEAMPKFLQDAQAACAFHISRNTVNSAFVTRHIEAKILQLVDLPHPTNLLDSMAQAQTLILYLAMLLSSPTTHSTHTQTSIALLHLEILALTFRSFLMALPVPDTPTRLPLHPFKASLDFFHTWIQYESAIRTYGIACFLLVTTYILRGAGSRCSFHSPQPAYADLSFPNSRVTLLPSSWEAKSALDFAIAWNENDGERLEVFGVDFSGVMGKTSWTRLDGFGKMLLVSVLGEDRVKGWY